jgi:hypothetical protein
MLLYLFVMAMIAKHTQELHEIDQHAGINLLARIEQFRDRTHAGHDLLNQVVIMYQFVNEVTHSTPDGIKAVQKVYKEVLSESGVQS